MAIRDSTEWIRLSGLGIGPKLNRIGPFFDFVGSHLTNARSGVEEMVWSMETKTGKRTGDPESADL